MTLLRGGLLLGLLGIGVVTSSGAEVTRARACTRAAVSWVLLLPAGVTLWAAVVTAVPGRRATIEYEWWALASLIAWLAGVVWAAYDPQRGPQDRLTGTYLVPR